MSKFKSEELRGLALEWAVCRALGHAPLVTAAGIAYRSDHGSWVEPRYTHDSEAGDLMATHWIGVERPSLGQKSPTWRAIADSKVPTKPHEACGGVVSAWGESLGVAVCRALVLSFSGPVVDVPEGLVPQTA